MASKLGKDEYAKKILEMEAEMQMKVREVEEL
jgi:hypothetical protein